MSRPPGTPNRPKVSMKPGHWVDNALCNPATAELFFSLTPADKDTALAICHHCPVQPECHSWALGHKEEGIWGGTTEEERARQRRERMATAQSIL